MATVERVTLKLDVDTNTSSLTKATGQLKSFERAAKSNDRSLKNMGRSMDKANARFGKLGRTFQRVGQMAVKFFSIFTKFSFIAYAGQVAVLTTALLGAKLAMATGRVAAQGYSIALKGVASAATAAATAVAIAAASMRQFQEARLSPFTGGVGGAAMRNRSVNPMLRGLMGSEATQQVLRGLSKSGVHVSQQNAVMSELFKLSGGDSKQMASLVGAISGDPGTFKEAVSKSAAGNASAARVGNLQGQELIRVLAGGGLTSFTGFSNLQNVMGETVIGTLKTEMQSLLNVFADVGEGLLGPTRETVRLMGGVLTNFAQRSIPLIMKFGDMVLGEVGLASGMRKMSNSLFRMMKDTLPRIEGFVGRMSEMNASVRMFFRNMGNAMRPLESGAEVLMSVFGEIFGGMGGNGVLDRFNRTLTQNADSFRAFGESIGNVFEAFFAGSGGGDSMVSVVDRMTTAFNQFAKDVVPPLKEVANTLKDIVLNGLPGVLSMLSSMLQVIAPVLGVASSYAGRFGDVGPAALLMGGMMLKGRFGRRGRQRRADGVESLASLALMSLSGSRVGRSMGLMPNRTFGGNLAEVGFKRFGRGIHAVDAATQGAIVGKGNIPPHKMDRNMMRIARLGGAATLAGGAVGGMSLMNAFGDARDTGDMSAFNMLQGAGGGAALGFMLGGPLGALAGGAIGGLGTMLMAGRARKRRTKNLHNFIDENLANAALSSEEALANFTDTLENFEEVAERGDMDAKELKDTLDGLVPVFDNLAREIETKVASRVALLTEVFGMSAEEADHYARTLDNIDFNRLNASNFNRIGQDAMAGFSFAELFTGTSAQRGQLQNAQAGIEAQLRSQFGGDLDLAAKTEEGSRLVEALYNNIFAQSMLEENQTGQGATETALAFLDAFDPGSDLIGDMTQNGIDMLESNKSLEDLIGEGNTSLTRIGDILDKAFGGEAEAEMRKRLGEQFDDEKGHLAGMRIPHGDYERMRQDHINNNIGTAMGNMLNVETPINMKVGVSGVLTTEALNQIVGIVRKQTNETGQNIVAEINDAVHNNAYAEADVNAAATVLGADYEGGLFQDLIEGTG